MQRLIIGILTAFTFTALIVPMPAQEPVHLSLGTHDGNRVSLTALSIDRVLTNENTAHVLRLKGNVEFTVTICGGVPKTCQGSVVVHADEAEYDVNSGEFQPRGNVRVTPAPFKP